MYEFIGVMGLVLFVFFFLVAWTQKKNKNSQEEEYSQEWEEKIQEWEDDYF